MGNDFFRVDTSLIVFPSTDLKTPHLPRERRGRSNRLKFTASLHFLIIAPVQVPYAATIEPIGCEAGEGNGFRGRASRQTMAQREMRGAGPAYIPRYGAFSTTHLALKLGSIRQCGFQILVLHRPTPGSSLSRREPPSCPPGERQWGQEQNRTGFLRGQGDV